MESFLQAYVFTKSFMIYLKVSGTIRQISFPDVKHSNLKHRLTVLIVSHYLKVYLHDMKVSATILLP